MRITRQKRLRAAGWGIPLAYTIGTLVIGMSLPRIEHQLCPNLVSNMSVASAMGICSSIASGMIALTGIVFSLAFLMVQFSATAYSPRLVLWVARDPVISHALGVFSATFLYALMLLAWVDRGASAKVPLISGWLVFVFLLGGVAMFIALIERVGLLQVNRMLVFTGDQGRKAIADLYPALAGAADKPEPSGRNCLNLTQTLVHSGRPEVIQAIKVDELVDLARNRDAVIEVVAKVGDTVLQDSPLIRVYSSGAIVQERQLKKAIETGEERTFEQDPKYALRLVVDIAIKALSPAINDPTTAVQALDQIEDLLIRLGNSRLTVGHYHDNAGALRLQVPFPDWEDFLRLALDEIRFYGASSVQVMRRMKALINNLERVLPAQRLPALRIWEERLHGTVQRTFEDAQEQKEASVPDRQGLGTDEENVRGMNPPTQ